MSTGNLQWYAVYCALAKEYVASAAMASYGYPEVYLPELRRRKDGRLRCSAFFPRYIFVRADPRTGALSQLNHLPGVIRVVSFEHEAIPIPDSVIEAIREQLNIINHRNGLMEHGFTEGERLRFKHGALRGLEAVFVGPMTPSERIHVLVEFFGSLREVSVEIDNVELARPHATPSIKHPRRTRGRGRLIRNRAVVR